MKKYSLLLVISLLLPAMSWAQTKENVARECVLFEVFTGVNCPYCPAAANGIAQLMEEGKNIAPVAYHTSAFSTPAYFTAETNARASYYGVTSYPTLKADGNLTVSGGGSASDNMYSSYLSRYNQRISQTSPFTIDLSLEPEGNAYRVNCVVNQVGQCDAGNVRVFIALTQCNINVSWQGMHGLHHVCRDMIPTNAGTQFVGPSMTISEVFDIDYPKEDCYLTAWVQNYSGNKEVYQAVRMSTMMDLDYDLVLKSVDYVATQNCSGVQHPGFKVKNLGSETVTSFNMCVYDGMEEHVQTWQGTLAPGEMVEAQMDDFVAAENSQLSLYVTMPNGHEDECMADNYAQVLMEDAPEFDGYIKIQMKSGKTPENESIVVTNMSTGEVFETLTFEQANHSYTFEFELPDAACYRIAALDAAGLGWDGGFFQVKGTGNKVLFKGGGTAGAFTHELSGEVYCNGLLSVDLNESQRFDVYPNPSNGTFVLELGQGVWNVMVFDMMGRLVLESTMENQGELNMSNCEKGVYFVKVTDGTNDFNKKIIVL